MWLEQFHFWAFIWKKLIKKDICTCMFIMALFTQLRHGNNLKCSSMDERIKKMWFIYTRKYHSVIKVISFFQEVMILKVLCYEINQRKANIDDSSSLKKDFIFFIFCGFFFYFYFLTVVGLCCCAWGLSSGQLREATLHRGSQGFELWLSGSTVSRAHRLQ